MITWMTRMSFFDSAQDLEVNQLTLQFLEAESLFNELVFGEANPDCGSAPTPLIGMWRGYEGALAGYAVACASALVAHGVHCGVRALEIATTVRELRMAGDPTPFEQPPWIMDVDFLTSHRSNLMRRWPTAYSFPRIAKDMPYLWPIVDGEGGYVLRLSKYDRDLLAKGERRLPTTILERIES